MQILKSNIVEIELPIKIQLSFNKIYQYLENQVADVDSFLHSSASALLKEMNQYPILKNGFDDLSLISTYYKQIEKLLSVLFPDLLQSNEIKAACVPFYMTSFIFSKRFKTIINDAGQDYQLEIRNFDYKNLYIFSCVYILSFYYKENLDYTRPFFFDIPNLKNNTVKNYRILFNADFGKIIKTKDAPEITKEDIIVLLNNYENIEVWKKKFPPNSYIFEGFALMNLFDVTQEENISNIKNTFIKRSIDSLSRLEFYTQKLLNISNLKVGISLYSKNKSDIHNFLKFNLENSLISSGICNHPEEHFCMGIVNRVFKSSKITAILNLEKYGKSTSFNNFYKTTTNHKLQSIILVPIELNNNCLAILEVGSYHKYQLNSINADKLKDIIPFLSSTIEKAIDEHKNLLESIIQENYTTIHPSVKWKFYNAVDHYLTANKEPGNGKLKNINFKNVYPIYGQCDVKGSSTARNQAIQNDLSDQLNQTIHLFDAIYQEEPLAVYEQLIDRVKIITNTIKDTLKTTDELYITDFFKTEIYPILKHVKGTHKNLIPLISKYEKEIDPKLNTIYKKRKAYEDFITQLNNRLSKHLDKAQIEAQSFFPHYYERFKTDGLDYNIYVGDSITQDKKFHTIYIENLRLWQLQQQCELEYIAQKTNNEHKDIDLKVTSLILVHSTPLDIKFRMDEKKFDVDGAYNIRYEIIKKRIDKSYIKNTKERLTQTGKIAVVYTHERDLKEYLKHIKYLTKHKYFCGEPEYLEIEDLQGVSGLKALRIPINFNKTTHNTISFKKLINN